MKRFLCSILSIFYLISLSSPLRAANILEPIQNDLVSLQDRTLKPAPSLNQAELKYVAFYFSSSWCICKKYSPEMVKWYNKTKKRYPYFELILMTSDKTEADMQKYMLDQKMEWPALAFAKKNTKLNFANFPKNGIHGVCLLNMEGKVLATTFDQDQFNGPTLTLKAIDRILAADPAAAGGAGKFDIFSEKK
jgi:nucleoredoxin